MDEMGNVVSGGLSSTGAVSGSDLMDVPTIYKAYFLQGYGSGDIPPISMAENMGLTYHFRILKFLLT